MSNSTNRDAFTTRMFKHMRERAIGHHAGEVAMRCSRCGEPLRVWKPVDFGHNEVILMSCYKDCRCKTEEKEKKAAYEEKQRLDSVKDQTFRNIPMSEEYRHASLEQWGNEAKQLLNLGERFFEAYDGEGKASTGFVVSGPTGIGKTYLLWAIANGCVERGIEVRLVSIPFLIERIKKSFDEGGSEETEASILGDIMSAQVIVIDELGIGKRSEWMYDVLFRLIDRARCGEKTIVCATNLGRERIIEYLRDPQTGEERLSQRLFSTSPLIPCSGTNRRILQEKEAIARLNE